MSIAMNRQAVFALFLLVLNTGYFIEALRLPTPFERGEPGPAFVPLLLSVILFVAAGRILIGELAARAPRAPEEEGLSWKPFLLAGFTAGFVAGFEAGGYWVATLAYTFAVAALFELERTRRPLRILAVAAAISSGVTVLGHLFFVRLFDLYLPEGAW
jgi:hypothetical protein